jgi:hypothetical protein
MLDLHAPGQRIQHQRPAAGAGLGARVTPKKQKGNVGY